MFNQLQFIFCQPEAVDEGLVVPFNKLCRGIAAVYSDPLGVIFDNVADRMDTSVYRTGGAEIRHLRRNPVPGCGDRDIYQFRDSFIFRRGYGDHGNSEKP